MKRYKHTKEKKLTERAGFYVAVSVCLMAVGMAVWSAYAALSGSLSDSSDGGDGYFSSLSSTTAQAGQDMTGVTEEQAGQSEYESENQTDLTESTEAQPQEKTRGFTLSETRADETNSTEAKSALNPMQAVLKVSDNLIYPVKSQKVTNEYSENSVYNKTMKDYRAHTGCDFEAAKGENVYAMSSGIIKDISVSELYGVIIEIECGDYSVYYCGLDSELMVEENTEVNTGDTIGTVGLIPSENGDGDHIHIEIRVGDKLIDPLSVISNNG